MLNDFYVPCLSRSILYQRAVGFFSSSSLAVAARGVVGLINNDGHMQLICSPIITAKDMQDILAGYESRNKVIESALLKRIDRITDELEMKRVSNLAWLIANSRLEIKVVVSSNEENQARYSIYHAKIGIFQDASGDYVAFSGSPNETADGLVYNYEMIDVFKSWDPYESKRAEAKKRVFESLWNNWMPGFEVLDFPEAAKRKLMQYKPGIKPTIEPFEEIPNVRPKANNRAELRNYQVEAIEAWKKNNFRGILAMATGTGKTLVALRAIESLPIDVLIMVIVPNENLVEQWEDNIRKEFIHAVIVKAYGGNPEWRQHLEKIVKYSAHVSDNTARPFVLSVLKTASSIDFIRNLVKNKAINRIILLIDEVHTAGATEARHILDIEAKWRLGLSATWERDWDPEGTDAIVKFFGGVVYEYPIERALREHVLSPYKYHIHPIALATNEMDEFRRLSRQLSIKIAEATKLFPNLKGRNMKDLMTALSNQSSAISIVEQIRMLLIRRVGVLKNARKKSYALQQIFLNNQLKQCIVYCNDIAHVRETMNILHSLNISCREYDSEFNRHKRRSILEAFRSGDFQVIVAVRCLDQGVDIPSCDSAVLMASSRSNREFIQRRGRLLRLSTGKEYSVIHDILVLPFTNEREGFLLDDTEYAAFYQELERAKTFALMALNSEEVLAMLKELEKNLLMWKI